MIYRIGPDWPTSAAQLEEALTEFLAGNKREQRPAHEYSYDRFGLKEEDILREFGDYRARYIV